MSRVWAAVRGNKHRISAGAVILALLGVFAAWSLASPVGASPDDDFHLISAWCAETSPVECEQSADSQSRLVPQELPYVACFAFDPEQSAQCQGQDFGDLSGSRVTSQRGNFDRTYPPLFYASQGLLASSDLEFSTVAMRVANAALFVALAAAVSIALDARSRSRTHLAWLITAVPLGLFFIPSNNPSSWAITGMAILVPALWGALRAKGGRATTLWMSAAVAGVMAAGARADAAVYVVLASTCVAFLSWPKVRSKAVATAAVASLIVGTSLFTLATSNQATEAADGLGEQASEGSAGLALLGYNAINLPGLWFGGFGATGLGWLDTPMPGLVPWASAASFIAVAFLTLRRRTLRSWLVLGAFAASLTAIPLFILQQSGDVVGANVQPRYLWPLMIGFALFALLGDQPSPTDDLGRGQRLLLIAALASAHTVALYSTMRRFITGTDGLSANLNNGAEWWWNGIGGPMLWWALGSLAFLGITSFVLLKRQTSEHVESQQSA